MEKTKNSSMVILDANWNDVGSWTALWDSQAKDNDNNLIVGDVILDKVSDTYIHSTSNRLVSVIGLSDLIVVDTQDAVLVTNKDHAQDVKNIVEKIKKNGRLESDQHRKTLRPWGYYDLIDRGEGFQVKRILVNPGEKLSLQKHSHRAEHWVVVKGKAQVICGEKKFQLVENQSTYIPLGEIHRLENIESRPLEIIEIQTGSYLGEDDIIRIDDDYDRE
jgi:mannose-1-phosphate guanylyltransferase/mannose-6-phosphate isomerase